MKKRFFLIALAALLACTFVLGGCGAKQSDKIRIATKPMAEQLILSEMLKLVIEDSTDYEVEITKGIAGGTSNIMPALEKGEFDLYPEYTSTAWQFVLKHTDLPPEDELFTQLQQEYKDKYDFEWLGMYGFSDAYGLAVRQEIADEYGLETYSDLAPLTPELRFGAEPDFYEREDGYDNLCATYGMDFQKTSDLDIGLKYNAIGNGDVDVINIFTTDGRLASSDVKVLTDDKHYFIDAWCGNVVRQGALERFPGLDTALQKLEGLITNEDMTQLNYQVEQELRDEAQVAKDFLVSKGIIS